jgi:hypothetical protein
MLIICQVVGAILLVFTLFLLYKGRVYLDKETRQPIEFEFPVIGKVKSQSPAFLMILVGAAMVVAPIPWRDPPKYPLEGEISAGDKSVTMQIVAVPHYQLTQHGPGRFEIRIPQLSDASYRAQFLIDKRVVLDQEARLENGRFRLPAFSWNPSAEHGSDRGIVPLKEVSDADLRRFFPMD